MADNRRFTRCPVPNCGAPLQLTVVREFYADATFFEVNANDEIVDWDSADEEEWTYEDGERTEDRFYCANDHGILQMLEHLNA